MKMYLFSYILCINVCTQHYVLFQNTISQIAIHLRKSVTFFKFNLFSIYCTIWYMILSPLPSPILLAEWKPFVSRSSKLSKKLWFSINSVLYWLSSLLCKYATVHYPIHTLASRVKLFNSSFILERAKHKELEPTSQ